MATNAGPLSGQTQRLAAAALIVVAVAVSVWVFGRPEPPEPAVQVVAAAEDWAARREPGRFVTVEVPEAAAALFVTPEELCRARPGGGGARRYGAVAGPAGRSRRRFRGGPVGGADRGGGRPVAVARSGSGDRGERGAGG